MSDASGAPHAARSRSKARLAAGACALALVLLCAPKFAVAQIATQPARGRVDGPPRLPDRNAHGPIGDDRLSADELYVEADEVTRDESNNSLIARGHVLARYQEHTLRAEELVYDTESGKVIANGHAEISNPDGTVEYGEHVVMDDKLRAGVVTGFAASQGENKVSAAAAVRRNEDVNELQRVIFTACAICTPTGRPTTPSWSIQAQDAVQDKAHHIIVYRNAVVKVKGVPVFWSPVFWTPDPTAKRQSGLLPPRILQTKRLGLSVQPEYLWVISPSEDLVVAPQINTSVNPLLNFDFRKRFYSGQLEARLGYTYERNFDNEGDKFGNETSRSYILANGEFTIDRNWRWGFTGEHASDATLFDRYDIANIYEFRGNFSDDTRRLLSQAYVIRQSSTSFISISALDFQSLRVYTETTPLGQAIIDPKTKRPVQATEDTSALPVVAPLIEARWDPDVDILNGRLRMYGSAVVIQRDQASLNPFAYTTPTDPCYQMASCRGVSDRRASAGAEWRGSYTLSGVRFEPFLHVRGDYYSVSGGIDATPFASGAVVYPNASIGRSLADVGVDVSYPLYRRLGATDLILEPMAELVASPKAKLDPRIPNEDSQAIDFDETNLFRPDRFPGYDLYEGGARASLGVMGTLDWGRGHDAHLFLGRAVRSENDLAFPAGSGLQDRYSDWIVYASTSPIEGLNGWTRERFDGRTGAIRRSEAAINWNVGWTQGVFRYLMDDTGLLDLIDPSFTFPVTPRGRREELEAAGYFLVTKHWGAVFDATRDIREDLWRRSEAGILYRDVCVDVEVVYQRNETNPLGPTSAVLLRLNFPMTGKTGFVNYDTR